MQELKVKYSHNKAKEILDNIEAVFKEETKQEDFYLKNTDESILKLKKEGNNIYLISLNKEKEGFNVNISERLDKKAADSLLPFFQNNPLVMKKIRGHYSWKEAEIVLDNVMGLGEFIEFYPTKEVKKEDFLKVFKLQPSDLLTKSYYEMQKDELRRVVGK